ncbi:MAG: phosphopantetheine-binding protein [Lachnospiraceae bacterium]|nr:phosphopantetheine-binding protein [Lachnospiraceae bacterium]
MVREKIREILLKCGIEENNIECEDYIKRELLDSIMMAEIIIEIEDLFNITIDGEDIIPEYFTNLDAIVKLVDKSI